MVCKVPTRLASVPVSAVVVVPVPVPAQQPVPRSHLSSTYDACDVTVVVVEGADDGDW